MKLPYDKEGAEERSEPRPCRDVGESMPLYGRIEAGEHESCNSRPEGFLRSSHDLDSPRLCPDVKQLGDGSGTSIEITLEGRSLWTRLLFGAVTIGIGPSGDDAWAINLSASWKIEPGSL